MIRTSILALLCAVGPVCADVAIIIANENYPGRPDPRGTLVALNVEDALEEAGFDVFAARDADAEEAAKLMSRALAAVDPDDRVVVMLSGLTVLSGDRTYHMAVERASLNAFSAPQVSISIDDVAAALSAYPARSLLLLGTDAAPLEVGEPVRPQSRLLASVPAGIAVAQGSSSALVGGLERLVAEPGANVAEEFAGQVYGYALEGVAFMEQAQVSTTAAPASDEDVFWRLTQGIGTVDAYLAYVARYPDGRYVAEANAQVGALRLNPAQQAEALEVALELDRDARRQIQRDLALLEFNPRGIDGIFGPGSRAAISAWQRSRSFDDTGFLTGNQILALSTQAETRAAELEAEAAARREAELRADTAYWSEIGQIGGETNYRAYLERYPDGQFAQVARAELDKIEAEKRALAQAAERTAWDDARAQDDVAGYRGFLNAYPDGTFEQEARARIRELRNAESNEEEVARARRQERQVIQNQITALLVERRLAQLSLNPGQIDGRFTDQTRSAVRNFQKARNLPVTGYVSQATLVAMLASRGG